MTHLKELLHYKIIMIELVCRDKALWTNLSKKGLMSKEILALAGYIDLRKMFQDFNISIRIF